jgi:hypothetical protein
MMKVYRTPIAKLVIPIGLFLGLAVSSYLHFVKENSTIGLVAAVLSSIGFLFFLVQIIPGANSLTLNDDGLVIRAFFRSQHYKWTDISRFEVGKIGLNEMVVFNLTSDFKKKAEADRAASEFLQNINGFDAALPSTYGLRAADLRALLNEQLKLGKFEES